MVRFVKHKVFHITRVEAIISMHIFFTKDNAFESLKILEYLNKMIKETMIVANTKLFESMHLDTKEIYFLQLKHNFGLKEKVPEAVLCDR